MAARWMKEIKAYDANLKEEYLIILGNGEAKKDKAIEYEEFGCRAYLYDFRTGKFCRIFCVEGL